MLPCRLEHTTIRHFLIQELINLNVLKIGDRKHYPVQSKFMNETYMYFC